MLQLLLVDYTSAWAFFFPPQNSTFSCKWWRHAVPQMINAHLSSILLSPGVLFVHQRRPDKAARLVAKVAADGTLQSRRALAHQVAQVLQVVAGSDAKLTHKVLGGRLQIAVVLLFLLLGAAKVRVGRDGRRAVESLEARLGLGLRVGVIGTLAKILVRRDTLLGAKLGAGVVVRVVCE